MKRVNGYFSLFWVVCIIFAPISVCSWRMSNWEEQDQNLLKQEGILHDADVQRCAKSGRTGSLRVTYQYEVEVSGEVFEYSNQERVPSCDTYKTGDVIKIRYLTTKPRLSTIAGNEEINIFYRWTMAIWYFLLYLFIPVVPMFLIDWYDQVTGKKHHEIELLILLFWGSLPILFACYIIITSLS